MTQRELFQPAFSNETTSKEAAKSMIDAAPSLRDKVFLFIKTNTEYGATCEEVETALNLSHQCASARITELHQKVGSIIDSGLRRKTKSGREAIVWINVNEKEK